MAGFLFLLLCPIVITLITIGISKSANRRYAQGGSSNSVLYSGDYSSENCDSFGGGFGGDAGGCGGGE
ncbi:hypothetical protein [Bacillus sp. AK031]